MPRQYKDIGPILLQEPFYKRRLTFFVDRPPDCLKAQLTIRLHTHPQIFRIAVKVEYPSRHIERCIFLRRARSKEAPFPLSAPTLKDASCRIAEDSFFAQHFITKHLRVDKLQVRARRIGKKPEMKTF
jgi:hypothetical protein